MRDLVGEIPDPMVGFTGTRESVFHAVASQAEEGQGVSRCRVALLDIRDKAEIRNYERPCPACWPRSQAPPRPSRVARFTPPRVPAVFPFGPLEARVTLDGLFGFRSRPPAGPHQWIVIDPANPLLLEYATDEAAEQWPTLRSMWPTEELISPSRLAKAHKVDRSQVSLWRRRLGFPPVSAFVGDRPGWYPELLPRIEHWITSGPLRRGRKPKSGT